MSEHNPKPVPYDPEIEPILAVVAPPDAPKMDVATLAQSREQMLGFFPSLDEMIGDKAIEWEDFTVPGPEGAPDVTVTVLMPRGHRQSGKKVPAAYNIHGGGMMVGFAKMDAPRLIDMIEEFGIVAATVEYRLAPEHPDPAPVEDCHAGLVWFAEHADELGVDPDKLIIMGGSAGGGLSAGVALLARDRQTVKLAGQLLLCPMIDDTNTSLSSYQNIENTTWTRESNLLGWKSLLGDKVGSDEASIYAAPYRAKDLSGLPPANIETGSAEMFRDENVEYANRIWAVGGEAELHIWSGGFHGFDIYAPDSELAKAAIAARYSWFRRIFGLPGKTG